MKKPAGQPGYHDVTIISANANGTYDVRTSTGKKEFNIRPAQLFAPPSDDSSLGSSARRSHSAHLNIFDTHHLICDSHRNDSTKRDDPFDSETDAAPKSFRPGDKIEARYRGGSKWYPGVISRKNLRDGSYAIEYDDGESELRVAPDLIRKKGGGMARDDPFDSETDAAPKSFRPGDKIEARYRGGSKWYPGVISRKNLRDGSYAIEYDDGESELRVAPDLIRKKGGGMARDDPFDSETDAATKSFRPGDKIEARYRGGSKWYPGVISRKNLRDGSYAIEYDDGESELRVAPDLIRKKGGGMARDNPFDSETDAAPKSFRPGDKIEARYRGGSKWYPGVISRKNLRDGSYAIEYDDGESELRVAPDLIRKKGGGMAHDDPFDSETDAAPKSFRPGDKIEARYRGGSKWYPGVISRKNLRDGSYAIEYDDGESELRVAPDLIRKKGEGMAHDDPFDSETDAAPKSFRPGDKIEARYRGGSKWYPGVISRKNLRDGSYAIEYDDGESELRVAPDLIRKKGGGMAHDDPFDSETDAAPKSFRPGDKIEARYRGGSKWYPGVISRKNLRDGSYAIEYDDGESELRVAPDLIRKKGGGMARDNPFDSETDAAPKSFRPGDKIEARYRGGSKWYPGVISRKNLRDGSYAIEYDDGESELRVAPDLIRKKGGGMAHDDPFDSETDAAPKSFRPGDKIEARYRGGSKWYPGVISRKNLRDGSYAIEYDDGESELRVAPDLIRKKGEGMAHDDPFDSETDAAPKSFRPGDKIEARYRGGSKWYPGVISRKNLRDGSYAIEYDDGESELRVAPDLIRKKGGGMAHDDPFDSETDAAPKSFRPGDKIEARYRGGSKWYPGVISRKNLRDGSYAIEYDDGESELRVAPDLIRKKGGGMARDDPFDSETDAAPKSFRPGDKIEARYRGGSKWYPGVISRKNLRDGSYAIEYDDGESELRVAPDLIRKKGGGMARDDPFDSETDAAPKSFRPGDKIEARYRGGSKWYPGVISRKNLRDGSYAIEYDDGESELRVAPDLIRKKGGGMAHDDPFDSETDAAPKSFRPGDKIEARYRGGSKWYPGVISRKNLRDGSYAIEYDDGESELRVAPDLIRKKGGGMARDDPFDSETDAAPKSFRPGDKIEARYRGGSKWYPGVISRKNLRDGSYAIEYDDGESELRVAPDLIRKKGGGMARDDPFDSETDAAPKSFRPGDKIEARYRGGSKWYPGVISRKNLRDGSYATIEYDDGESELRVAPDLIRKKGGGMAHDDPFDSETDAATKSFRPGDKIEARYRGGSKWYPGVISRKNLRDGSYAIEYDDGESELRVAPDLIRKKGGGMARDDPFDSETDAAPKSFRPGDKVEARYRGGSKWYPGVISRKNLRDGSYAIEYDDGESELRVAPDLIRKKGGGMARDDPFDSETDAATKSFRPGDKIEARYRGGSKWYPGVISRKNLRDGSYAIEYDDGESELRVAPDLIRKKGGGMARDDPFDSETDEAKTFKRGDQVEARYRDQWLPGVVRAANRDGSYDIRFDSGTSKMGMPPTSVRSLGISTSPRSPRRDPYDSSTIVGQEFVRGDKVEAKLRNHWLPARILKQNRDSTYDVRFDGGDTEYGLPATKVRDPNGSVESGESKVFRPGDKIEARYRGGSKWYPGVISRKNLRDGSYAIEYDDGESELRVAPDLIRKKGGGMARDDPFDSETEADDMSFREGDKVEARFGGGQEYYPGVITRKNRDGTYAIDYADGDNEGRVKANYIRKVGGRRSASPKKRDPFDSETEAEDMSFREGDKVEARFGGGQEYYPGVITRKNRDGTYAIDYADGDNEGRVKANYIRKVGGRRSASPKKRDPFDSETEAEDTSFREGDKVEARFGGGQEYYPGVIARKNRDGTYAIDYADGDNEGRVKANYIRKVGGRRSASPRKRDPFDSETEGETFRRGDKVEARYRGRWLPARVLRHNSRDGTYDVKFDGGDEASGLHAREVRARPGAAKQDPFDSETEAEDTSFREGDKVEARFGGGQEYYPGVIARKNRDGTYAIDYADGDNEGRVKANYIRKVGGRRSASPRKRDPFDSETEGETFRRGDKVEARYRGRWLPARVLRHNSRDGTYDVKFDGGDEASGLHAREVRARPGAAKQDPFDSETEAEDTSFREGDKVEARFGGGQEYYPGVITRKNRDGTYAIDYADGDNEGRVKANYIRKVGGRRSASPKKRDPFDSETEAEDTSFREGDKVEARFGGGQEYYPGVITRKNRDGTYAIDYADGDNEGRVKANYIRKVGGRRSASPKKRDPFDSETEGETFGRGDKVEARYRGRWLPARVLRHSSRDGTYDVKFDGGDEASGLHAREVRARPGAAKQDPFDSETEAEDTSFREGDKVEARFGGGQEYYPGVITRKNRDGTYAIDYADGDNEGRVKANYIRKVGGRRSASPKKRDPFDSETEAEDMSFREGDKVEARFGGGQEYYPGVIARKNRDGTYAIDYADGDNEGRVKANYIRKAAGRRKAEGFERGDRVLVNYRDKWRRGRILKMHRDGTYDVRLDAGKDVEYVEVENVKADNNGDGDVSDGLVKGTASHVITEKLRKQLRDLFRRYVDKADDSSARSCFVPFDAYSNGLISKRDFRSGLRDVYSVAHPSGRLPFEEWIDVEDMKMLVSALLVPDNCERAQRSSSNDGERNGSRSRSPNGAPTNLIRYDSLIGYAVDSIEEPADADLHRHLQDAAFKKSKYSRQSLLSVFEKVDSKKKGFIRTSEFLRIVTKFYRSMSGREEKLLKSKVDANAEGIVDYYGFVWWLNIGRPDYADEVGAQLLDLCLLMLTLHWFCS